MSANLIGKRINGYEIIRVLGRGGMGVVYKAHEMTLQRVVALKVLPNHLAENKEFITRFYREARAAAQLNHPNVVTIHRVGSDDGYHYIAMEYLKGRELSDVIKEKGQLGVSEAMEFVRQVASALAAAHELGILHRDIKPQNIMIDHAGRVKVMDFGIAKINEPAGGGQQALTMTGQLLGTPAYMSPEQCKGTPADQRSDVYSLGVVLYQGLAGRVPFTGETPLAVIRKIVDDPVPAIYAFKQDVPDSVVQIMHKALAKEPEQRYQTAADFENDIKRFLGGQEVKPSIEAESPTLIRLSTPSQGSATGSSTVSSTREMTAIQGKKKSLAPVLFFLAALVIAAGAIGFGAYKKTQDRRERERVENQKAEEARLAKERELAMAAMATPVPVVNPAAQTPEPTPQKPLEPTATPRVNHKPNPKLRLSASKVNEGDPITFTFSADDPDDDPIEELSYNIDGRSWQKVPASGELTVPDLKAGKHKIEFRAKDSGGEFAVIEQSFSVSQTSTPAPTPVITPRPTMAPTTAPPPPPSRTGQVGEIGKLEGHTNNIMAVAFSADGKRLMSGGMDNVAYLWDLDSKKSIQQFKGHANNISAVALSPDGRTAMTGGRDNKVILWDIQSGKELRRFERHQEPVIGVAFAAGGATALSASEDGTICVWETGTTSEVRRVATGKISCVGFSADGRYAVTGGQEKSLGVWDLQSGSQAGLLKGGINKPTQAVALSPDGRFAASGGLDKNIQLWDVKSMASIRTFPGHEDWVKALAFSRSGREVISGGKDYTIKLWDVDTGTEIQAFRTHVGSVLAVAFSPKEAKAASGSADKTIRLWALPE